MTRDLLSQPVTKETALMLTMVDGSTVFYYPVQQESEKPMTFRDLVSWMQRTVRSGGLLRTGDPERYSDLCSIKWVNAAHIVSFQKAGGHR